MVTTRAEQGESRRAAPQGPDVDDGVAGPGATSQNRCAALEVAQDRDGYNK